jgi:hypothetical protein
MRTHARLLGFFGYCFERGQAVIAQLTGCVQGSGSIHPKRHIAPGAAILGAV